MLNSRCHIVCLTNFKLWYKFHNLLQRVWRNQTITDTFTYRALKLSKFEAGQLFLIMVRLLSFLLKMIFSQAFNMWVMLTIRNYRWRSSLYVHKSRVNGFISILNFIWWEGITKFFHQLDRFKVSDAVLWNGFFINTLPKPLHDPIEHLIL